MNRRLSVCLIILLLGMITGCAYFQKPEPPPPLPPIEEPKPPFTMKSDYFKTFPWDDLPAPQKDGNEPDTFTHIMGAGESLAEVAEKEMGNRGLAEGLAKYNKLPSSSSAGPGDKIIIPYPIIGVKSEISVKSKGDPDYGSAKPFPVEFKKGDEYKLQFTPNTNGYLYVFRQVPKVAFLYPPEPKKKPVLKKGKGKANRIPEPPPSSKVEAYTTVVIPETMKGFIASGNPKNVGNEIVVFFSIESIPELEALKDRTAIKLADLESVKRQVKDDKVHSDPPYKLLRIAGPREILGFNLPLEE